MTGRRGVAAGVRPNSKERAVAQGSAFGTSARELTLPADLFEQSLRVVSEDWGRTGLKQAWIIAGKQAARLAYRGKINRAGNA
jgi:hypothetical protein